LSWITGFASSFSAAASARNRCRIVLDLLDRSEEPGVRLVETELEQPGDELQLGQRHALAIPLQRCLRPFLL
jgi:hypothetical protein